MIAAWTGARCILCLKEGQLSEEHVIPRALGGVLTCSFLCLSCNSRLGSDVEASARSDPSILRAVHKLKAELPRSVQRLVQRHPHVASGDGPQVTGHLRDGTFRVQEKEFDDGSLIKPPDRAGQTIAATLRRQGYGEAFIERALAKVESMPENVETTIAPGLTIVNWRVDQLRLDLSKSRLIEPLLAAKIAFEFLALCAGTAIYAETRQLSDVREVLKAERDWDDAIVRVTRLLAKDARPFHGICSEENTEHSQIQIRLFGHLAFRVHFPRLHVNGPRVAYTHDLDTGDEWWEPAQSAA